MNSDIFQLFGENKLIVSKCPNTENQYIIRIFKKYRYKGIVVDKSKLDRALHLFRIIGGI
jgi:hypothetical protein